MEQKTYHIRKTIDIVVSAPWDELQDDTERWASQNIVPDCLIKNEKDCHRIEDVRIINDEDDQDSRYSEPVHASFQFRISYRQHNGRLPNSDTLNQWYLLRG